MGEGNDKKKKRIVMIIAGALLLVAAIIIFFVWRSKITATTMRILRLEGDVSLEEGGTPKSVKENLRLKSGNALTTAVQSLVSIGLDDTKIVTLNENSRAEFNQSGRKLDLRLTAGSLYFDVSKPLTEEESFDIRTSTMVVGIRGTSGIVSVEGSNESLLITDGTVHVVGTNPFTKEVKEIDVKAGQRITVYLYNDRDVDSIEFMLEEVTEHELPTFVIMYLREHLTLLEKVVKETGWDKDWILGIEKEAPQEETPAEEPSFGPDEEPVVEAPKPTEEVQPAGDTTSGTEEEEERDPKEDARKRAKDMIASTDPGTGIVTLTDGTLFDPEFYAASNPDVVAEYGDDTVSLIAHYIDYGKEEGRPPMPPVEAKTTPTPAVGQDTGNGGSNTSDEAAAEEENEDGEGEEYAQVGEWDPNAPDVMIGGRVVGRIEHGKLVIDNSGANINLPLALNSSSGGTKVINSFSDIDLAASSSAGTFRITDTNSGAVVRVNQQNNVYKVDMPDGSRIAASSLSDLQKKIRAAGL